MPDQSNPTARRILLGAELRTVRHRDGRSATEIAALLEWSTAKLTRLERGQAKRPLPRDVQDLLDVYGVTDPEQRERFDRMAREARQRDWLLPYRSLFPGEATYLGLEGSATTIRTVQPLIIPGQFQTRQYALASMQGAAIGPQDDIEQRVALRMARQDHILPKDDGDGEPLQLWAVIGEAALRCLVGGPEVMAGQLERLVEAAQQDNVVIQVLPFAAGSTPAQSGQFVILDFDGAPTQVYLESSAEGLILGEPDDAARYTLRFQHVVAAAHPPGKSLDVMRSMIDQLT